MLLKPTPPVKDFFDVLSAQTGIKNETLFTVCTTLFVFCAGILSNWLIKKLSARTQRTNYRKTVNLLLIGLRDVSKKQYELSSREIGNINLLDGKLMGISQHVYSSLPFLNKIDYSVFLSNYIRGRRQKLKIKAASKVFKLISNANILEKDNEEKIDFFMAQVRPLQDSYIRNMLELEQFQRTLPLQVYTDFSVKKRLLEIFSTWDEKHVDNNFRTSFTHLVSPLLYLLKAYPLEPELDPLAKMVRECHFCYSEISHNDDQIRRHLQHFIRQNKNIYKTLDVILRIFK